MSANQTMASDQVTHNRELHAVVMRVVADLHAAYGDGVSLDIRIAEGSPVSLSLVAERTLRDVAVGGIVLSPEAGRLGACFWDDGQVTLTNPPSVALDTFERLEALAVIREFIHRHGCGPR